MHIFSQKSEKTSTRKNGKKLPFLGDSKEQNFSWDEGCGTLSSFLHQCYPTRTAIIMHQIMQRGITILCLVYLSQTPTTQLISLTLKREITFCLQPSSWEYLFLFFHVYFCIFRFACISKILLCVLVMLKMNPHHPMSSTQPERSESPGTFEHLNTFSKVR